MTLIYEIDLGILNMFLHAKNEVYRSRLSKVRARTGHRQTDATECITAPHSRMVMNDNSIIYKFISQINKNKLQNMMDMRNLSVCIVCMYLFGRWHIRRFCFLITWWFR